jgi:hypothetical protein
MDAIAPLKLAAPPGGRTCVTCQRPLWGRFFIGPTGERFCDQHTGTPRCLLCSLPAAPGTARDIELCQRCAATSVREQADVKRLLPPVRRQLHRLGIRTTTPAKVRLVSIAEMGQRPGTVGMTYSAGCDVADLMILRDLPEVVFGATVAHEAMHTYMAQRNFGRQPPLVAEGLSQLLAYTWLSRQGGMLARAHQRGIERDPDPVYGDGFRLAKQAAERHGVRETLHHVHRHRAFPTP